MDISEYSLLTGCEIDQHTRSTPSTFGAVRVSYPPALAGWVWPALSLYLNGGHSLSHQLLSAFICVHPCKRGLFFDWNGLGGKTLKKKAGSNGWTLPSFSDELPTSKTPFLFLSAPTNQPRGAKPPPEEEPGSGRRGRSEQRHESHRSAHHPLEGKKIPCCKHSHYSRHVRKSPPKLGCEWSQIQR